MRWCFRRTLVVSARQYTQVTVVRRGPAAAVLKNMAVHELALAVTFYGVTADSVVSVDGDKAFSVCETRNVRIRFLACYLTRFMETQMGASRADLVSDVCVVSLCWEHRGTPTLRRLPLHFRPLMAVR